jgi:hypothetical protein
MGMSLEDWRTSFLKQGVDDQCCDDVHRFASPTQANVECQVAGTSDERLAVGNGTLSSGVAWITSLTMSAMSSP